MEGISRLHSAMSSIKSLILVIATLLLSLVSSAPTQTDDARACTTILPYFVQHLSSADPDSSFVNTAPGPNPGASGIFSIYQNNSGLNSNRTLQFIDFALPPNRTGCKLAIVDHMHSLRFSPTLSPPWLNVISLVPNALRANPTYNDIVDAIPSVVSNLSFALLKLGTWSRRMTLLGEEACPPSQHAGGEGHLQFVFHFGSQQEMEYQEVILVERNEGLRRSVNGVVLLFDC